METRSPECPACKHGAHGPSGCGEDECPCVFGRRGPVDGSLRLTYSPGGPVAPSVAQLARGVALSAATALYAAAGMPECEFEQVEALALRWARFIETGSVDG